MEEKNFQSNPDESEIVVSKGETSKNQQEIEPMRPTTIEEAMENRKEREAI